MINITINGKKVEVEEGTSVLQAAEELGIKIPTLCYHKALPAYGACRLCLVEISQNGGTPSIQASCTYPVQEGLIVKTDTEQVIKTRKMMVELLLARCPDSEEIKNLAKDMGVGKPRIEPKNEDCLLCGLCVRMCSTRMKKGAISFANRGYKRVVQPAFDVKSDVCQTCGACYSVCPTKTGISFEKITDNKPIPILSEFDEGLVERSAIYIPYAQAIPNYANIDKDRCVHIQTGACEVCKEFCKADAIDFDQQEEKIDLNVGAVIVATGAKKFDPSSKHEYGYKKYKNVLTSIQFERILSASGPFAGHVQRPADGKLPRRIAWIQCVGSRDEHENKKYCSSVCCMYSIKEAVIAKEHVKQIEPTIFFMDIRAYGKDFDKYYERAKETGVRFIRARVGKVEEIKESGNLLVHYVKQNGKITVEEFELVVLSVGFQPPKDIESFSDKLDVRLNQNNFIESKGFYPIETTRSGIFISGPAVSPKDIPETVMQSSGAVAEAAELLSDVRGTEIVEKKYPPEKNVMGQKPRIGVFVCYCGINIGSVVDVPAVVEYARTLPNVTYTESNLFTCSQDTQQTIKEKIKEHNLNRVVVASCSPTTHEPLFQETLKEAGLNPYLFEMANIRNQCSWVHREEPKKATEKAKTLVKIAVGKAKLLEPLQTVTLDVTQKGLVIGGGFAGMISALSIAEQGFEVALIEREKNLGGNLRKLYYTPEGKDVQEYLNNLIHQVESNPYIKVFKNSNIKEIQGYIGNYKTIIKPNDSDPSSEEEAEYEHGIIVIATGGNESKPDEYLYKENENVITQLELEKNLITQEKKYKKLKNIVMIQCVGSRNDEHPYCSRVCCTQAIKNAIRLKELNPKVNIFILYRDIRTYGFQEMYYQQARDKGVIFIRYEEDEKPVVSQQTEKKNLIVEIKDQISGYKLVIEPDRIVLAPAMVPQKDAYDLSQMLKIPLNEDNFFMEAHVKLRPVDFAAEGIFLAGLAHSPKGRDETISQAKAAAERACTIISSDKYTAEANVSTVDEELCAGCGICVSVCPYGASELVFKGGKQVCEINTALCKGCGSCACICPSGAMQQYGFKEVQTLEMVYEAL